MPPPPAMEFIGTVYHRVPLPLPARLCLTALFASLQYERM